MRRSTKAALFSGLVFPGLGHLYLRRYVRGLLLAAGTAALLYVFVSMAVDTAYDLVGKIESGEVQPDVDSISEMVSKESQNNGGSTNIATMALLALWVIGIADSYREGRVQEKAEAIRGEKKT